MSDIKLFHLQNGQVAELEGHSVSVEKSLQNLIERHLEPLLGIRFLASEYSTGPKHGGRIDTLGIDENGYPVIIEYKRALNENVINQGLYYLDWLMDHQSAFAMLVMDRLGAEEMKAIEWSNPRLICIAGDFTKYDEYAVKQINRNIELIRYRRYGSELLLFELVHVVSAESETPKTKPSATFKTPLDYLKQSSEELTDVYEGLTAFLTNLGDDVQIKHLKYYIAFKRIRNFACVEVHPQANKLLVFVKVSPDSVELRDGFTRDVRSIGHFGTGDLEITLSTLEDLEAAKGLLVSSYEAS